MVAVKMIEYDKEEQIYARCCRHGTCQKQNIFYRNESIFLVQDWSILKKGNYILNKFSLSFPYNFLLTTINSTIISKVTDVKKRQF